MYCKHCGQRIDDDAPACPYCGMKVERTEKRGGGLADLLRYDAPVLAAFIIMIPVCLYLLAGGKKESEGNGVRPDSQETAIEQPDQTDAAEEQSLPTATEEHEQSDAAEEPDQAGVSEKTEKEVEDEETVRRAPDYAMEYRGHHYYIFDNKEISFSKAAEKCEASGGHLAKIDDEDENEALYSYMLEMRYEEAFFGLIYEERTGEWINYDGSEAVFFDWGTNSAGIEEPNNSGGNEYNVQLDINMRGGHWNDAKFGAKVYTPEGEPYKDRYTYICEWDY